MSTLIQRVTILVFSSMASPASLAQITLDGTLGRSGALPGPDYQITANLGQQVGANLYHSFGQFNLQSGESATFSGPESVNQVIGRVTGGFASQINGTLRSTTNVYLLNPAGIVFGEGARLDVQGSFHASTADTLRFEDGSEFNARQPNKSLLTLAPIRAFGFVSDTIAPITVAAGRGQIGETDWDGKPTGLSVPEGKTLSLIGGNIEIKNGTFYDTVKNQNEQSWTEATRLGSLNAPGGRLNLASVNSAGEVISTDAGLEVSAPRLGDVTLAEKSLINVSGRGAGNIFIRAGHLLLRDSDIWANTLGGWR
ncbi:MAG: hypothetical protein BWK78_04705 [Thiotrichaceae bacterium IS1]|nr:MAG: hypothetical protein BWK78_04705 [Thiotrichaceae bacterium IS1]